MARQARPRRAAWSLAGFLMLAAFAVVAAGGRGSTHAAPAPSPTAVTPQAAAPTTTAISTPVTPTPALFGPHGDTYVNPTYGWTIHWDPATWPIAVREIEGTTAVGVALSHGTAAPDGTYPVRFYAESLDQTDPDVFSFVQRDDPLSCLQGYAAWGGGQQQVDATGQPRRGIAPDRAWAVYLTTRNGNEAAYVECRTLVPHQALILFLALAPPDQLNQLVPMAQHVAATLQIPQLGTWTPTPAATATSD